MAETMEKAPRLRPAVQSVAALAGITDDDGLQPFCDYVCDTIETVNELFRRGTSSEGDSSLIKAARAALALNQAVSDLDPSDREWVNKIAVKHPILNQKTFIRGAATDFEIDELKQSTWLMALLFNFAVNRSSPETVFSVGSGKKAQTWGIGNNLMFEFLLRRLLTAAREAGGEFTYSKDHHTGTLAKALDILKGHLPSGVIPEAPRTWVVQAIKTEVAPS